MLGVVWCLPGSRNVDAGKLSLGQACQDRIQSLGPHLLRALLYA